MNICKGVFIKTFESSPLHGTLNPVLYFTSVCVIDCRLIG